MIGQTSKHITQNTTTFEMLTPILDPVVWLIPGVARFGGDLLFGTSAVGYPRGPMLASPGAPLVRFS